MRILITITTAAALGLLFIFRPVHAPAIAARGWDVATAAPVAARPQPTAAHALVYVAGEVVRPGVYPVAPDARVGDAVERAGGLRPAADPSAVNFAAHVSDGDEILVTARGAAEAPHARRHRAHGAHRRSSRHPRRTPDTESASVDINAADAAALANVPGIGPGLAERIVAFRTVNGPFTSPDELLDVSGITDRRLEAMLPYVVAR